MSLHRNIPIFIPHLGCPNMCVFCNQRSISGKQNFVKESVDAEIEKALSTIPRECEVEIAFFGGSFTGIDRGLMIYLLDTAQKYIDRKDDGKAKVTSIRLSTRPDYIDEEILAILSRYSVKHIELGLQSMDDSVLRACRRGHDAACGERACRMVVEAGFELVGQMMIGLPGATPESEIYTAERICDLGASAARIYPTVVFYETELCEMAKRGEYTPISNEDAIEKSKNALKVFDERGVKCIRIGLCASENLSSAEAVYGGANHSALGELILGERYFDRIRELFMRENIRILNEVTLFVPQGDVSKAIGQHRKNVIRLREEFGISRINVREHNRELCVKIAEYDRKQRKI